MATLHSPLLFFTTSPRSPEKMIPEILLLQKTLEGQPWTVNTQTHFGKALGSSDFFEGKASFSDPAFSARDRITRGPKSLGFVELVPTIRVTKPGLEFISNNRPNEIFLRQILKFQLPSPNHKEPKGIHRFWVRPYLEIIRLIHDLEFLTFDELMIFGLQLIDYRKFAIIKDKIQTFRNDKKNSKLNYKEFRTRIHNEQLSLAYDTDILKLSLTEDRTSQIKSFLTKKRSNSRDYADACVRYLRYSGLVNIKSVGKTLVLAQSKKLEIGFILGKLDRNPTLFDSEDKFFQYMDDATTPELYSDNKTHLIELLLRLGDFNQKYLQNFSVNELKDLRDDFIAKRKNQILQSEIESIKSYNYYNDVIDTYHRIVGHNSRDDFFDPPLILEWNTWRAMTMLDGGSIKGNFSLDDDGNPLSTAPGKVPDIICNYEDFEVLVEVTLQRGLRQFETEGEPVSRHYGDINKKTDKDVYCLFIAEFVNESTLTHFYSLSKSNFKYYGGIPKIIPMNLSTFIHLIDNAYNHTSIPNSKDLKELLDGIMSAARCAKDENEWNERIVTRTNAWLIPALNNS